MNEEKTEKVKEIRGACVVGASGGFDARRRGEEEEEEKEKEGGEEEWKSSVRPHRSSS